MSLVNIGLINKYDLRNKTPLNLLPDQVEDRLLSGEKALVSLPDKGGRGRVSKFGAYIVFSLLPLAVIAYAYPANAADFVKNKIYYASLINQNFLPNGTLVKTATSSSVYYILNGKKSIVLPSIINLWFKEAHYFKIDSVVTISATDLALYPKTKSVNPLYIGKILRSPDGTQYFIDNKLRKRKISASVRAALRFPSRNLYPTTASHLAEFIDGPEIIRTDVHPGGTVMYNGSYHGGTVWRIEETGGKYIKHYYLQDYIYETEGYPWSGQIMSVTMEELARYERGSNIERYPDGWQAGIGNDIFIVQNGALRLIGSPTLYKAMGYNPKYILKVFPELPKRYPRGENIAGFKNIFENSAAINAKASMENPVAAWAFVKVRPAVRDVMSQINDIYLPIFDKEISATDNKFWLNYIYSGEISTKAELIAAFKQEKAIGKKPIATPRTGGVSMDQLKNKWFPYMFYFVFQREPSSAGKEYWYSRINSGDRNSIDKLGETMQWLKDKFGVSHK